jgi:pyroglutamyl-peptidase
MRVPPAALVLTFALIGALIAGLLLAGKDAVVQQRTVLLTGFGPFGTFQENPSWQAVQRLDGAVIGHTTVHTAKLDVVYAKAADQLQQAVDAVRPDAVVLFGVARGDALRLETTARNLDTSAEPDVEGVVRQGEVIHAGHPATLPSRLPLEKMQQALDTAGLPVRWSHDAGGYLCNHVFYAGVDSLPPELPVGFVHVPPIEMEKLEKALHAIVGVLDQQGRPATDPDAPPTH